MHPYKCLTRPAIHVRCKKFADGQDSVVCEERPGHHVVLTTDAMIAAGIQKIVDR